MLKVFEAKSYRVKGISFHPNKPWVLTSLHNGIINIYDYVNGILLHSFEDHDGPVRTVDFHFSQPLFASGGDDCKIKIWNYQLKKCMFTLNGHTDYIRTVQFHHEFPWLISSSDDQTIRIWNWQSRTLLTTAAGHDHYVMTAFFHPSQNLIVSASLDQSIRIWDFSNLRKKYFEHNTGGMQVIEMDIILKHKLDGHERGVNWAVFHPSFNLIASGSDDKTARIWKFSDTKWDEVDCFRGHTNNVSSVLFHRTQDYLITNSEDKTYRVWDLTKKTTVYQDKRENDRFWIIANHPSTNLFAFGTDSGLVVNKLEKMRIPSTCIGTNQSLFYSNHTINLMKENETTPYLVKDSKEFFKSVKPFKNYVNSIQSNPFIPSSTGIFNFGVQVKSCESNDKGNLVHYLLKSESSFKNFIGNESNIECTSFCFISKNKLAYFNQKSNSLFVCDVTNISNIVPVDTSSITSEVIDSIHQGQQGKIILKLKTGIVCLLDLNTKKITHETNEIQDFKFIIWNAQMTYAALVGEKTICIINKNLDITHTIKENSSIKSAVFDENSVLFYSTYFHIKYCLINGLSGIIKSTEMTYYLMLVSSSIIYYSDFKMNKSSLKVNYIEIRFNIALMNKNYEDVVAILKTGQVSGLKIVEDLKNSGFPDLSLKFVTDPKQKFVLAIQSGKLEEAFAVAEQLKDKIYYNKLAEYAMLVGNLKITEACYVRAQNLDKLMFFYFLSGKFDKLKKLEAILKEKGESSRKFTNTIYTCNHVERLKILHENEHCK